MGQRGPKPLPGNVHQLRGNPSKKALGNILDEFRPEVEIPDFPSWIWPEAKKEWKRIGFELERYGLVSKLDRAALVLYCQAWAKMVWAERMLARAQEIENLEKQLRAQALISEESRSGLVRAEAAYADASQRLIAVRREASETQSRAHELQVETLRLTQLAEQTRARSAQLESDIAEVDAQLEDLQERRVTAEGRFEELDMQLADSQERHAQLDERVIDAERKLNESREQQRSLERQAQEATFSQRTLEARRGELQRAIETAAQQAQTIATDEERAKDIATFRIAAKRRFWSTIFIAGVLIAGLRLGLADVSLPAVMAMFCTAIATNWVLDGIGASTRWYRRWFKYVFAVFDTALISGVVYLFGSPVLVLTYILAIVPYSFDRGPALGYLTTLSSAAGFLIASYGYAQARPADAAPWAQVLLAAVMLVVVAQQVIQMPSKLITRIRRTSPTRGRSHAANLALVAVFALAGLIAGLVLAVVIAAQGALLGLDRSVERDLRVYTEPSRRQKITEALVATGERHLVFVHPEKPYALHLSWVFNDARFDRAPVLWAWDRGPAENLRLIAQYPDRRPLLMTLSDRGIAFANLPPAPAAAQAPRP